MNEFITFTKDDFNILSNIQKLQESDLLVLQIYCCCINASFSFDKAEFLKQIKATLGYKGPNIMLPVKEVPTDSKRIEGVLLMNEKMAGRQYKCPFKILMYAHKMGIEYCSILKCREKEIQRDQIKMTLAQYKQAKIFHNSISNILIAQ
jgi:hypothetical protein